MVWLWVLGCTSGPDDPTLDDKPPPDSETATPTGDTGTPGPTADTDPPEVDVVAASCSVSANALRVDCTVALAEVGSATVVLSAKGVPSRTLSSTELDTEHDLLGWGLVADTTYDWTAGPLSGVVTTGSLPADLAGANVTTTGTAFGFDAVLQPLDCNQADYFVMIDGEGRIVWYEANDVFYVGSMNGYDWSAEAQSVMSLNSDVFVEQHISGAEVLRIQRGVDFDGAHELHHDTSAWGSLRYLLFERVVGNVNVDGIEVFDGSSHVGTWFMEDDFKVSGGGGSGNDWGHANGLNVSDQGEIILSILNFDAVVAVDGDPASATFLQTVWHAAGSAASGLPDPDYLPVVGPGEGFDGQHNAGRYGDDLWVFDNLSAGDSRAIRMTMDHQAGTLALDAEWSLGQTCRIQGGSLPIDGGVLATCANSGEVFAFEEGQATAAWTLEATCNGGGGGVSMTRGIPIGIP